MHGSVQLATLVQGRATFLEYNDDDFKFTGIGSVNHEVMSKRASVSRNTVQYSEAGPRRGGGKHQNENRRRHPFSPITSFCSIVIARSNATNSRYFNITPLRASMASKYSCPSIAQLQWSECTSITLVLHVCCRTTTNCSYRGSENGKLNSIRSEINHHPSPCAPLSVHASHALTHCLCKMGDDLGDDWIGDDLGPGDEDTSAAVSGAA